VLRLILLHCMSLFVAPRLKTTGSQHFIRLLGCCGRDLLGVSLSAFDPTPPWSPARDLACYRRGKLTSAGRSPAVILL
jgi:hypothetical protein